MENQLEHTTTVAGHEPIDTDVRPVWITAAVIVAVVVGSYLLVVGMIRGFFVAEGGPPTKQATITEPSWDEQNPLQLLRIREHQLLTQFEWVDQSTGIARIPLERAIELVAENGLPSGFQAGPSANATSPQPPEPSEGTSPPQEGDPP